MSEPDRELGHERDRDRHEDHDEDVADGVLRDVHDVLTRNGREHVEVQPHGRRQNADRERNAHDDPELRHVVAEALGQGDENRHRDEENGRTLHEAPHDDEDRDDEKDHGRHRGEVRRDEADRLLRDARVEKHELEEPGRCDHEHHLRRLLDRLPEDARKVLHVQRLRDAKPEEHDVERRHGRGFRRREEPREDPADHDDGGQKGPERFLEGRPPHRIGFRGRFRVVVFVTDVRRPRHESEPQQEPRERPRFKKRIDARGGQPRVENQRDARRDDRPERTARRNRGAGEGPAVARARHFGNGDQTDPRRTRRGRPRHGGHHDACRNGGVREPAPAVAEAHAPKPKETLRDPAYRHEVPHQKEERNRHQRDARHLREHALRHEEEPRRVTARKEVCGDGRKAHRDGRGHPQEEEDHHGRENEKHGHGKHAAATDVCPTRPFGVRVYELLNFINGGEEFVHGFLAGELAHLLVRGLHLRDERFAIRDRNVHALLFELLNGGGFAVRDLVARQILCLHGFFLQDLLHLGRQPVEEGLVGEEHLAVEVVVRERQLILRFVERVGEDREDGVFFTGHDTLLQRRVEFRIGNALRVGANSIKRGEQPRRRRNADLDTLEIVGRVDDNTLRRRLTEAVVEHRKAHGVVVFELLVHPTHHESVDHLVRLIVVGEKERSRHRIELLRVHGHVAERHDRKVERPQRHLLRERRLVAELARRVDLDHVFALRAVLDVLSELQRRFVVHVRHVRRVGEADGRRRPGSAREGEREGSDGGSYK